jgi:dipeptidyl aminopeptidase/acylaminoacyl peptidase
MRLTAIVLFLAASLAHAQDEVLVPGDNLIVDGVPPIPARLAKAVDAYTRFRTASFYAWHPTKREMLVGTRAGETSQIHSLAEPGGKLVQLTNFPDSAGLATYQPKEGKFFVFQKAVGGNERYQNYRFDLDTKQVTLLTDGTSRNSRGVWSRSGKIMAYTSTRRNGKDSDLYLINPLQPKSDRLLLKVEGGGWTPLGWSPGDRELLIEQYVSINETYLWVLDVAKGTKTLLTPRGTTPIAYHGARFSRFGKGVYLTTDMDSEFNRLAYYDLETKSYTFLTSHIKWDIESFALSPDGTTIAFLANEDGVGTLRLFDALNFQEMPRPKLPAGSVSGIKWNRNNKEIAFHLTSARTPTDVFSIDITTNKVERWTKSETAVDPSKFAQPELIRWKSFDGRDISGFLYKPAARFTGKRPVIVNIHGGPESQYRPTFLARYNYFLNELGIAMIFPNIRGSAGYGKTFLQLDNGLKREDAYKDINALFDWIAARPDLDSERVLVTGGSYGGHMTLAVATYYPERVRCSIDVVGISSFVTFLKNTEDYRRDLRRAEYGDERDPKMREFMERTAPLNNAHKITRPLFIIQGKNDPRVPWTEAEQMVKTLKRQNTPVWYLLATDEGHGFVKKKNADFQFYATVQFIQTHLLK